MLVSLPSIFDHMLDKNGKRTGKTQCASWQAPERRNFGEQWKKFKSTICMNASAEDGHWIACTDRDAM